MNTFEKSILNILHYGLVFFALILCFSVLFVWKNTEKIEYGPEKEFVVNKKSSLFRPFRQTYKEDFCPECFFYYVQDADNGDTERKIIVRRKKDGVFLVAKLKNPELFLKRGEKIKLIRIQYWRSMSWLDEYLIADVE